MLPFLSLVTIVELGWPASGRPAPFDDVNIGCVSQAGEDSRNVGRHAMLRAGLPIEVAATTVDAQCGSSQQATNLAYALVASGVVDAAIGCGVEVGEHGARHAAGTGLAEVEAIGHAVADPAVAKRGIRTIVGRQIGAEVPPKLES